MTEDAELVTGDPRWHNFLPRISPLGLFFPGVEASGALSWDVGIDSPLIFHFFQANTQCRFLQNNV